MSTWWSRCARQVTTVLTIALVLGMAGAVVRAARNDKFNRRRTELERQWQAQRRDQGLAGSAQRVALYSQYPTPEIGLAKSPPVDPGAATPVSVPGKFSPDTVFLVEHDDVELSDGALSGGAFKATLTVSPDAPPGFIRLYAFAPVSGAFNRTPVAFIGSVLTYDFRAKNGWTIKVVPTAQVFTLSSRDAKLPYRAEFYKAGEEKPFETMSGVLTIDADSDPGNSLYIGLQAGAESGSAQAELEAVQAKLSDPKVFMKMSAKEQEALMKRMEVLTDRMMKATMDAMKDPEAMQRKQDEFGCGALNIYPGTRGKATGSISCGQKVGSLELTGTATAAQ